jgi:predicted amino acid-binding ACT domain protein
VRNAAVTIVGETGRVPAAADLRPLLQATALPQELVDELLGTASPIWLMSAPASLLAADIALAHPPLAPEEVRAIAHPLTTGLTRISVVAHDRQGLLADTAGALAAEGLSVMGASAMTWPGRGLAVHALTVPDPAWGSDRWTALGHRLRRPAHVDLAFLPLGGATVSAVGQGMGRCLLTIRAPDQVGLLWSICRWLADTGIGIEAARVGSRGGLAEDHFLVVGVPEVAALTAHLGGGPRR